jgi:(S)-citramalyl-CoA lyase
VTTEAGLQDLLALRAAAKKPPVVLLPKTESVAEVAIALAHLTDGDGNPVIVALIESARGLEAAAKIASHPAVSALALGAVDLAADLQAELTWESVLFARGRVVQAAVAGGAAAWDAPFLDIHNDVGLVRETTAANALGFTGKLAIHPRQIGPIHSALAPNAEQLAKAERIVAAFAQSQGGACMVDGKMIDLPVVLAAQRTVRLAARGLATAALDSQSKRPVAP